MQHERASKRQQELLSFVDGFIKGNGYGPSYREIMRALGYKSVSTVAIHIDGLIAKGYLARRDKSARSLEVVTLRADASDHAAPTQRTIEPDIVGRVESLELTPEQLTVVAEACEILGYDTIAARIRKDGNDA